MNWRYYIGSAVNTAAHRVLANRVMPLSRYVPRGTFWLYDVQRFAGTRDLSVLFDIGANTGQTAYGLVRYFPSARIYCFEPVKGVFDQLAAVYGRYPKVRCVQKAVGSAPGTATMALRSFSEMNSLVGAGPAEGLTGEVETVEIDTIDSFCKAEGLTHIDLLKMDVQGWELEVLKGAARMIDEGRVRFVFTEVGFRRDEVEMVHFSPINDTLERKGFRFCGLYSQFRWGIHKQFVSFANALYVNVDFVG